MLSLGEELMLEGLHGFTWIDIAVLVIYMLGVLITGIHFSKRKMQGKEFFKSDGSVPWFVTSVSIFATIISPLSFLSLAGKSYEGTWLLWFAQMGTLIAIPLTIKYLLPIYARLEIDTAYHYLEIRFKSPALRVLGAVMFVIFQLGRMAIVMYLPCVALGKLANINVDVLIIAMGAISIIYSYTGGLKAVLWTDFIQGVILLGGIALTLIYIICKLDSGVADMTTALTSGGRFLSDRDQLLNWSNLLGTSILVTLIGGGLTTFCTYISSQDIVQRFTTTTNVKHLTKMTIGNGLLSIVCASLFYMIGTALYLYYQQHPEAITDVFRNSQDKVVVYFITYELPVGVTGIILAALYAAAQSSISTGINSIATSWVMDVQTKLSPNLSYERQTKIAKYISLAIGIFAVAVAMYLARMDVKSAYELFKAFLGQALGALAGVFILGAFTRKTSALGAFSAFIAATAVILYCNFNVPSISFWTYSLIAIVVTMVVGVVVSKIQAIITGKTFIAPEGSTYGSSRVTSSADSTQAVVGIAAADQSAASPAKTIAPSQD